MDLDGLAGIVLATLPRRTQWSKSRQPGAPAPTMPDMALQLIICHVAIERLSPGSTLAIMGLTPLLGRNAGMVWPRHACTARWAVELSVAPQVRRCCAPRAPPQRLCCEQFWRAGLAAVDACLHALFLLRCQANAGTFTPGTTCLVNHKQQTCQHELGVTQGSKALLAWTDVTAAGLASLEVDAREPTSGSSSTTPAACQLCSVRVWCSSVSGRHVLGKRLSQLPWTTMPHTSQLCTKAIAGCQGKKKAFACCASHGTGHAALLEAGAAGGLELHLWLPILQAL